LPPYDASANGTEKVLGLKQRGAVGLAAVALGTAIALALLQQQLLRQRPSLNSNSDLSFLRRSARFDPDPQRRREARLILVGQVVDSASQLQLLRGQGWGNPRQETLLAPISLKLEALAQAQLGQTEAAKKSWQYLFRQFPAAPPSADALYALSKPVELFKQFPAHPAALAAAVKWHQQKGGSEAGLHLARYGKRWPGAGAAMAAACKQSKQPVSAENKQLLAAGLVAQGDLAAANRCLGDKKTKLQEQVEPLSATSKAWQITRELLVKRQWAKAYNFLAQANPDKQSAPIAARSRFWMGLCAWQQGQKAEARAIWQNQLQQYPYGYYAWRASVRLGVTAPAPTQAAKSAGLLPAPLAKLESLGLHAEAWEHWRTWRLGQSAQTAADLWREGQLRLAVGDRWLGLAQLDNAALAGVASNKEQQSLLEKQRHPLSFSAELGAAARKAGIEPLLLQGVARQESRLNTTVRSPAGAVGLLQLMPATAQELAGVKLTDMELEKASLNSQLGGRYLKQMLVKSKGNIFIAIASYNAGPGAAGSWQNETLQQIPELWVETIPYPETRIYVKSVLGGKFSYEQLSRLK